jgi:dTDP-4-amino-4,6-dideoxygalactose transaminase
MSRKSYAKRRDGKPVWNTAMRKNFLVFGQPDIAEAEIQEVESCMRSAWLGTGPRVAQFEREFAQYKGSPYCVAVNSCTAALHVSLLAAGVGPGDEVVTTPMTFCATVNAILHAGATPVLADIDPATLNIDPTRVEAAITPRTRAILPVHFAGRPCDMNALCDIAHRRGLKIIEDCAHAVEAEQGGKKTGTFGDFGCFSFYATKNITCGEGGMVLCRRQEDAAQIQTLALHGLSRDAWKRFGDDGYKHYAVTAAGFKYNMMDLQAAIGIHQLRRVEANHTKRQAIWRRYMAELADLPVVLPSESAPADRHAFHLFTIEVDERQSGIGRDDFLSQMTSRRLGVGVHYLSLPEHPFYQQRLGWRPEDYPAAMRFGRRTVSLPLTPQMTSADVTDVIAAVRGVVTQRQIRSAAA